MPSKEEYEAALARDRAERETLRRQRDKLVAACEAALRFIQPTVEDEEYEEHEGAACKLHDQLLEAITEAKEGK